MTRQPKITMSLAEAALLVPSTQNSDLDWSLADHGGASSENRRFRHYQLTKVWAKGTRPRYLGMEGVQLSVDGRGTRVVQTTHHQSYDG